MKTLFVWLISTVAVFAQPEVVLHDFGSPPQGQGPWSGVIRDEAGFLFGTTVNGGTRNLGVIYKVDKHGHSRVLHSFAGGNDGEHPYGPLARDAAGNLYGTTYEGGTGKAGIVFKLTPSGDETVLYNFTGGADGGKPVGGVILDSAGNLYGTASQGGPLNEGVLFRIDTLGNESVIYTFTGRDGDGGNPQSAPTFDAAGNLYGTTYGGGLYGQGTVYKVDSSGNETVLFTFNGSTGYAPYAGVIVDSSGNLFGTTHNNGQQGVVYKLDAKGREKILHSFSGSVDGGSPIGGVVRDTAGNLYGVTYNGGASGAGVIFKIDTLGNETALYSFTGGDDGGLPEGTPSVDSAGLIRGTTSGGGSAGNGAVFELTVSGQESALYSFPGPKDGVYPNYATLSRDPAGNLYGTTEYGGVLNKGTVYKIDTSGNESILYTFSGGSDGGFPMAGVTMDAAGNLYGTTVNGGVMGLGVVYKIDVSGNQSVLHSFTGGSDGADPWAGVAFDAAGNLYGTTYIGGTGDAGTIYKIDTAGNETVLYSFTGLADGSNPWAGVTLDTAGNLYGTTYTGGAFVQGVVYKLDTSGNESALYSFSGAADGSQPVAGVIFDPEGNLYGTTVGPNGGVVYKLDSAGHQTVLHTFGHKGDGRNPYGGVVLDAAGNLYGTAFQDGPGHEGIVYMLDPSVKETILASFDGHKDGGYPLAGVVLDAAGNIYGTTAEGGTKDSGVVFEITAASSGRRSSQ